MTSKWCSYSSGWYCGLTVPQAYCKPCGKMIGDKRRFLALILVHIVSWSVCCCSNHHVEGRVQPVLKEVTFQECSDRCPNGSTDFVEEAVFYACAMKFQAINLTAPKIGLWLIFLYFLVKAGICGHHQCSSVVSPWDPLTVGGLVDGVELWITE